MGPCFRRKKTPPRRPLMWRHSSQGCSKTALTKWRMRSHVAQPTGSILLADTSDRSAKHLGHLKHSAQDTRIVVCWLHPSWSRS